MFSASTNPKLRGAGFRVLNVFRVFNIITLLAAAVATMAMAVVSIINKQFFAFDFFTLIIVTGFASFLIATEIQIGPLKRWISGSWPVFGPNHSFFWLGAMMIGIGCFLIGKTGHPPYDQESMGLPMWRLVMAAGILCLTFGFTNWAASAVFRDSTNGITARMIRSDGNLAAAKVDKVEDYYSSHSGSYTSRSASVRHPEQPDASRLKRMTQMFKEKAPFGGSRKPKISRPIPQMHYDDADVEHHAGNEWDRDSRASPIIPDVRRPETALHPALIGGNHNTHYSVADSEYPVFI